ncbi:DDE-domain-containing protein, partial [Hyaloscypha bicolor E]
ENIKQIQENRDLAAIYPPENVLNMDKTGLYWKISPNRILVTEASNGGKRSKERITLVLTVNATGTNKWEPWLIGKSKNPRYFKHVNRRLLGI